MFAILLQLVPVFAYFGLGVLIKHKGLAERSHGDFLLRLVFFVTLPMLILTSVSRIEFSAAKLLLPVANIGVNLVCLGASLLVIRWFKLKRPQAGTMVVNTSIANNSFIFPFILAVYGQTGFAEAILFDFGNAIMLSTLVYALAFHYSDEPHSPWVMLKRISRSPLVWSLIISVLFAITGVALPDLLGKIITPLGQMTSPLILIALGIFFSLQINQLPLALGIAGIRMGLGLVAGVALATLFGFEGLTYKAVVLCSASPIGFNALTYCSLAKLDTDLSASAVSISIIGGMFYIPLLILWLGA